MAAAVSSAPASLIGGWLLEAAVASNEGIEGIGGTTSSVASIAGSAASESPVCGWYDTLGALVRGSERICELVGDDTLRVNRRSADTPRRSAGVGIIGMRFPRSSDCCRANVCARGRPGTTSRCGARRLLLIVLEATPPSQSAAGAPTLKPLSSSSLQSASSSPCARSEDALAWAIVGTGSCAGGGTAGDTNCGKTGCTADGLFMGSSGWALALRFSSLFHKLFAGDAGTADEAGRAVRKTPACGSSGSEVGWAMRSPPPSTEADGTSAAAPATVKLCTERRLEGGQRRRLETTSKHFRTEDECVVAV